MGAYQTNKKVNFQTKTCMWLLKGSKLNSPLIIVDLSIRSKISILMRESTKKKLQKHEICANDCLFRPINSETKQFWGHCTNRFCVRGGAT